MFESMTVSKELVVFAWSNIPEYAIRCINAFVKAFGGEVVVISAPGTGPDSRLEEMLECKIVWTTRTDPRSLKEVIGRMPGYYLSGWHVPAFYRWAKEAKGAGARLFLPVDECYLRYPVKELLRCIRWRLKFSDFYDCVLVCGVAGRRLFRFYGVPDNRIFEGMCEGDPTEFYDGPQLSTRTKRIVFVGRFVEVKNILTMCEAWRRVCSKYPDWRLELYGDGPIRQKIPKCERMVVHGFKTAHELGYIYRDSQCLVLGSYHDNWGVVVHEAAMSGCLLLLSDRVGAIDDFATPENSAIFKASSVKDFARGMEDIMSMSDEKKNLAQRISVAKGAKFSPQLFVQSMMAMINLYR